MDEPKLSQMEANARRRLLWMLLNVTFLVPGDSVQSRESWIFGLGGVAGLFACSSALVAERKGSNLRRHAEMITAPQFVVFVLIMILVLIAAFPHHLR